MLSLLLITALAVQYPPPAPQATSTTRAQSTQKDTATATSRSAPVSRQVFHDRMRQLWSDHIVYTRSFIVSASAGLPDTAEVLQRLLRNQDELGEAIRPYYGDAASTQLASLLRSHIQHAGKALVAAKGNRMATQTGMNPEAQYQSNQYGQSRMGDTTKSNSQYPGNNSARMTDTTKSRQPGSPSATQRSSDTTRANARVTGDTISQRLPSNQYGQQAQPGQQAQFQTAQVDSVQLNQAVAALKANGDSIATFLAQANPRNFSRESLKNGFGQHITLLLQEVTAHLKGDWSGSITAVDESHRQAMQMADMLSEGIMKQYPSRFTNRSTSVSSR